MRIRAREFFSLIRSSLFFLAMAVVAGSFGCATAQVPQVSGLQRQLSRLDLGVSGAGEFTRGVSGPIIPTNAPNAGQNVSENGSNTVGALATLRYIAKPYVGFEFNFGYSRYTENFSYPPPNFGVQTNANEFNLGYVVTPPHLLFGLQPFASVGLGTIEFKPTRGGGQGLKPQARADYYYSVGLQQEIFQSHFGIRASFRQLFYLAPDYGQNYFTIKQRAITSEPTAGFYLRF